MLSLTIIPPLHYWCPLAEMWRDLRLYFLDYFPVCWYTSIHEMHMWYDGVV